MKLNIVNTKNATNGSIDLPTHEVVREDLIRRAVKSLQSRARQPYGADPRAGLKHATNVSRRRRKYRGSYGHGISRVPRKVLSRSGIRFFWRGAEAPGTVGGRRAHPPKAEKIWAQKINKKENRKAINSAITAALTKDVVASRGHAIPDSYPFVLDTDFDSLSKTKDVRSALLAVGFEQDLLRGENGGKTVLIVTESATLAKAAQNIPGVDVASARQLNAHILAPGAHPGRATLFTKASVESMTGQKPKAPAKKTAEKKAPAKKVAEKKTPTKKAPAKKAPAKKTVAKEAKK